MLRVPMLAGLIQTDPKLAILDLMRQQPGIQLQVRAGVLGLSNRQGTSLPGSLLAQYVEDGHIPQGGG